MTTGTTLPRMRDVPGEDGPPPGDSRTIMDHLKERGAF